MIDQGDLLLKMAIPLLLGGNIYFIKRLITRLDENEASSNQHKVILKEQGRLLQEYSETLREVKSELKEVRQHQVRMEIDVALVKQRVSTGTIDV